jgi:hypothetical protein
MRHPSWKQTILAAALAALAVQGARAETRSIYLCEYGAPWNFLNSGISPGDLRGFTVNFGPLPAGSSISAVYFSYAAGSSEEAGGWGWYVPPGDGSTFGRVDWVATGLSGTLMMALTDGAPPAAMGAMPTNVGANPARRMYFGPTYGLLNGEATTIWADLSGLVLAPEGATIAQPRFFGIWPYLTIEISELPPPGTMGVRNGDFASGDFAAWSVGGGNGTAVVVDLAGSTGKAAQLTIGNEGPIYLSQLTAEGVDDGVLAFDLDTQSPGTTLSVTLDNREIARIAAAATPAAKRHYVSIPPGLRGPNRPLTFTLEGTQDQSIRITHVTLTAQNVWENPLDPRDGGAAEFVQAGNLTVEQANGAILWGTRNDNGSTTAERWVSVTGDLTIDEFSWARTQTRGGAGDSPATHFIQGALINHGLLSLGTAGNDLGVAANLGSDLTVKGAFHSDSRLEVHNRTLTVDGNATGSLAGSVVLAGGTFRSVNGGALAGTGVSVSGTGLYDVAYADGSAVRLEGAINYVLDAGGVQQLAPHGGPLTWSGMTLAGGSTQLTAGLTALIGAAGITNAGQIQLQDAATKLTLPDDPNTANWREFAISGNGTLAAATGTTLELIAGTTGTADQHARIANAVVLASGATLKTRRPLSGSPDAGTNLLSGGLVNHGALVLGDATDSGSDVTVSGGFQSDGTISTKDGVLTVHEAPAAALGNSLVLSGGGLRGTGTTVFAVENLSITGQGTVDARFATSGTITRNLEQTAGVMNVSGGQLVWSGAVGSGATLGLSNGAVARIPDVGVVINDGQLTAASGGALYAPRYTGGTERRINGAGSIDLGAGGLLDLDPVYYANVFGSQGASPVIVENNVSIAPGGEMLVRQGYVGEYYYPGTATVLGALTNGGTVNLGTAAVNGSHLSILGQFNNTGTVNLHGCTLSIDGSAGGTVGGQVNLHGGSFVTNGTAAIIADDLTIRGSGNVALNALSGKINFLGADTAFSLSGAVPAGLTYQLGEGAQMNVGTTFSNNGVIGVAAAAVFKAPWAGWGAWWNENTLAGSGAIAVGAGGRMEMTAAELHNWDWHQYMWLAVDNAITIAPGGELRNLQGVMESYYGPGTNIIRGPLVNQGTLNLGTDTIPGSHLRVTGSFANSGIINAYGRDLYVSPGAPDALAQFGGQVNLFGSYFGDETTPVSPGLNPVICGTGTVALQLAGGQVTLRGEGTSLALSGGLGAGAKLTLDGGAYAEISPVTYRNDGELVVTGTGTVLRGPMRNDSGQRSFSGSGIIRVADGARMEVESFTIWWWGGHYNSWTRIDNDLDIQAGGEFKTILTVNDQGSTEIYGHVANAGTLNVAMPLSIHNPLENHGLIRLSNSLGVSGKLTNGGTLLYDHGYVSADGGIEQVPEGEIRFTSADAYTIAKTGTGHVFVEPGQAITFAADTTLDGWELPGTGGTGARIITAQTGAAITLTGQWPAVQGPFGAALNLGGTDGRIIVLEMSYAAAGLNPAYERTLYLGWNNAAEGFVHAVAGNTGRGAFAVEQFLGSWETLAASGHSLDELLGSYGIDTQNHRVWALVNRASAPSGEFYSVAPSLMGPTYDAWAAAAGLTGDRGCESRPDADPDHDGRPNIIEFALAGNPLDSRADGNVLATVATLGKSRKVFTLTLPLRSGAVFSGPGDLESAAIDGIVYHIQGSVDLADYTTMDISEITGPEIAAIQAGLPALPPGWTYRTFRPPGMLDLPSVFLRASVTQP